MGEPTVINEPRCDPVTHHHLFLILLFLATQPHSQEKNGYRPRSKTLPSEKSWGGKLTQNAKATCETCCTRLNLGYLPVSTQQASSRPDIHRAWHHRNHWYLWSIDPRLTLRLERDRKMSIFEEIATSRCVIAHRNSDRFI